MDYLFNIKRGELVKIIGFQNWFEKGNRVRYRKHIYWMYILDEKMKRIGRMQKQGYTPVIEHIEKPF